MNTLNKIIAYAPEKKHMLYGSIFFSMVSAVLVILPYYFFWKVLQALFITGVSYEATYYAILMVALMAFRVVAYLVALMLSHLLAFRVETNMKKEGTNRLLRASFSFYDQNSSGAIRKIIDDNTGLTHTIVAHLVPDMVHAFLVPILLIGTIFMIDLWLGLLILVVTLIGLVTVRLMFGNQDFMLKYMQALERLNAETVEYVRGMQVVKIFNAEVRSFATLYSLIKEYANLAYAYTKSCRLPYVSFQVLLMLFTAFTVPFAARAVHGAMGSSEIIALVVFFACFAGMLFNCFMKIMFLGQYQTQGNEAIDTLEDLMGRMEKRKIVRGHLDTMNAFDIGFENVTFSYTEDRPVFKNLSFHIPSNQTVALVGSSGSGKSTIAKLVSGFYDLDAGRITIGGIDIREYTEEVLNRHIAFVFQNAKLFKTSIYENVHIGNLSATDADVMAALRAARCEDILAKFSDGAHTLIGAKGVHLSGGERQRIAIARAILKDADIIILDEASAAADPENEYELQQAFTNLMKGKTVIMIAHRLSSIRQVDDILVVEEGRIIERGDDQSLMSRESRYRELQRLFNCANEWRVQ